MGGDDGGSSLQVLVWNKEVEFKDDGRDLI
jgi:hypothetical protein